VLNHAAPLLALTGLSATGILAATVDTPGGLGTAIGGGAGVVAVGALAEVTRRLLNGRLIPREIRDAEAETAAYIVAAGQREDRAMKLVEENNSLVTRTAEQLRQHNAKLAFDLAEVTQRQTTQMLDQLGALTRAVQDLRDEIREARREGR
jgi:hypothetical protein